MKKSVWAVVAGVLVIFIVTTLVDVVQHATNVYPAWNQPLNDNLSALAIAALALPQCWLGGWFYTRRIAPKA